MYLLKKRRFRRKEEFGAACGGVVNRPAERKEIADVLKISPHDVISNLEELPDVRRAALVLREFFRAVSGEKLKSEGRARHRNDS